MPPRAQERVARAISLLALRLLHRGEEVRVELRSDPQHLLFERVDQILGHHRCDTIRPQGRVITVGGVHANLDPVGIRPFLRERNQGFSGHDLVLFFDSYRTYSLTRNSSDTLLLRQRITTFRASLRVSATPTVGFQRPPTSISTTQSLAVIDHPFADRPR